jgi:hypothetical protein
VLSLSYSLSTCPLYEDRRGANIATALQDILSNWQLPSEKLIATATDYWSNIVNAFNNLNWVRQLSYFGHNLHLAVNKALQCGTIPSALAKCCHLVELFNRRWKKPHELKEQQRALSLSQHKLIGSVCTHGGQLIKWLKE